VSLSKKDCDIHSRYFTMVEQIDYHRCIYRIQDE